MRALWLRGAGAARRVWARIVWRVAITTWCRRLRVEGRAKVPGHAVVIVANHASHADTVVLQYVLATCHHRALLVAGAEDYWFRNRAFGAIGRLLGVFAFPRSGDVGVERTKRVLDRRMSVLVFPQGTRSGGRFRSGIGRIAVREGTTVLPVHIDGTDRLLPKGAHWPRRTDMRVRIGDPTTLAQGETPEDFAARLERIVFDDLGRAA